jgi:thiosulfate reductase cytochrome b subunit
MAERPLRYALPVRVAHWLNVLAMAILLLSGLQIFNAHPALYWGDRSDRDRPLLALTARLTPDGLVGVTRVLGHEFETTGVLGASRVGDGGYQPRGFPSWATLPGPQWLAMGRRWHLFFAWLLVINGIVYLAWSLRSRHLTRDLVPRWRDWRALPRSALNHLRLRFEHAPGYNPLQKLSYAVVVLVLGPLILLTGLAMSPWIESIVPISELFGGRQSARTVHFVVAFSFLAFTLVHVLMVLLTGPLMRLRGIVLGNGVDHE